MSPHKVAERLAAYHALPGWRGVVAPMDETHDWAAAIYSPDYVPAMPPAARTGRMVAARGQNPEDAIAQAVAKAREGLDPAVTQ
jgi:hypothetical protein